MRIRQLEAQLSATGSTGGAARSRCRGGGGRAAALLVIFHRTGRGDMEMVRGGAQLSATGSAGGAARSRYRGKGCGVSIMC